MKFSRWKKILIIVKGSISFTVAISIITPFTILKEEGLIKSNLLDRLEQFISENKITVYFLQKMYYNAALALSFMPKLLNLLGETNYDIGRELEGLASSDLNIYPSTQRQLFSLENEKINSQLIKNPNLIPELMPQLFMDHSDKIFPLIQKENFKYNNPRTQQLLEKYLLLL